MTVHLLPERLALMACPECCARTLDWEALGVLIRRLGMRDRQLHDLAKRGSVWAFWCRKCHAHGMVRPDSLG